MTLRNTKYLSSEWPKQPTLLLKVISKNNFPNTKMVNGISFSCYSLIPHLSFFLAVSIISHIMGKYFLRSFPFMSLLCGPSSRLSIASRNFQAILGEL